MSERRRFAVCVLWAKLALALSSLAHGGEPIAYVLCGGTAGQNVLPCGNKTMVNGALAWALECGPKFKAAKVKRVLLQNPGGIHFKGGWCPNPNDIYADPFAALQKQYGVGYTREMWIDQWLLAEACGPGLARMTNREDVQLGFGLLRRQYGVEEIICYLGSPETLRDPLADGPACVEPFLHPGVSFGFDHSWRWRSGDPMSKFFDWLRKRGHKVYVEPRMSPKVGPEFVVNGGQEKHIDGTIAEEKYDLERGEDMTLAKKYGEVIRLTLPRAAEDPKLNSTAGWPAHVTPELREKNNWFPDEARWGGWHLLEGK